MSIQRNAQAFYLSSNLQVANVSPFTITATSALDLLMDGLYFQGGTFSDADRATVMVSALSVSGQSIMSSNASMPISCFQPSNNYAFEGINSLSLTIATSQVFSATVTGLFATALAATNPVGFAISTEPTDIVVSPNDSGGLLNYCFGLGNTAPILAGAQATLTATCLRDDVFLGRLVMDTDSLGPVGTEPREVMQITSILVNGIELLSAVTPATSPLLLSQLCPDSNDKNGLQLNYRIGLNSQISITVVNNGANPHAVSGGIFCKPIQ